MRSRVKEREKRQRYNQRQSSSYRITAIPFSKLLFLLFAFVIYRFSKLKLKSIAKQSFLDFLFYKHTNFNKNQQI